MTNTNKKSLNKITPEIQESGTQTRLHDFEYQLSRCTQTRTDDWHVWTPWVCLIRRLMVIRRRQLLFYSNGIQLQCIPRCLLDRISDANMSIGQGGPVDREWPRWSAAGLANILDQAPEAEFTGARENLRLYRNGVGRYSDVVVTRDIIRLHQAGLGRYARDPPPALEQPPHMQSAHWHEGQRESAAQALREGMLHEPPGSRSHHSPSVTPSYAFSSRGDSPDSIS